MLKLVTNNAKRIALKVTAAREKVQAARDKALMDKAQEARKKALQERLTALMGDKDYDIADGEPMILRLMRKRDGEEVLRFLATYWTDPAMEVIPGKKLWERGYYLEIVPKDERIASGAYGTYFDYHIRKECFALIVTKQYWRCRCPDYPVKGIATEVCPQCGTEQGDVPHGLRLIDDMI